MLDKLSADVSCADHGDRTARMAPLDGLAVVLFAQHHTAIFESLGQTGMVGDGLEPVVTTSLSKRRSTLAAGEVARHGDLPATSTESIVLHVTARRLGELRGGVEHAVRVAPHDRRPTARCRRRGTTGVVALEDTVNPGAR
ncbi:MAG: hypothetical protein ACLVKA_03715 [Collinsella aerofaciens]